MKRLSILMVAAFLFCGCATFGTFDNFKQGETTKAEVKSMLGEPKKSVLKVIKKYGNTILL